MSNRHTAYTMQLVREFEAAVRAHQQRMDLPLKMDPALVTDCERTKEKLARKIGQLAKDAARAKALQAKLDDMYDYKDRSPL